MLKNSFLFFLFSLFIHGFLFGQNLNNEVKKIEQLVGFIQQDSSLILVTYSKEKNKDFFNNIFGVNGNCISFVAYYRNRKLIRIQSNHYHALFTPTIVNYYLDNDTLIYIEENYYNQSRMGSCGGLDIKNKLFYSDSKLIKSETIETPFSCYHKEIAEELLLNNFNLISTWLKSE